MIADRMIVPLPRSDLGSVVKPCLLSASPAGTACNQADVLDLFETALSPATCRYNTADISTTIKEIYFCTFPPAEHRVRECPEKTDLSSVMQHVYIIVIMYHMASTAH